MSKAQRHVIKRQVIELTVQGGTAYAQAMQDEISRIYRQRIIPMFDQRCSELSAPDRLHRIESLDLDLGKLDISRLEEDFVSKVDDALSRELAAQIRVQEQAAERSAGSSRAQTQLELFVFFVRTGSLPWWADIYRTNLLKENLAILLDESQETLARELKKLLLASPARQRIINHYSDQELSAICGLIVPDYQTALKSDVGELIKGLTECGNQSGQIRQSLWNSILMVSEMGRQQHATITFFYKAVLKKVEAELGSTTLWADLHLAIKEGRITLKSQLAEMIANAAKTLESKNQTISSSRMSQLQADPEPEISGIGIFRTVTDEINTFDQNYSKRSVKKAVDLRFSQADEYPVTNAGLVILWPFLGHFFNHVGLLDEEHEFKDFAARQRAAGLLQVIATKEADIPEYLLPLNKMLCGLDAETVFEFGPPLRDEEVLECENLLQAVIAQAPILREMTTDGFRGSFLIRPGILGARDGMGLLRVERQSYDIVLDRFPWSWEWVKQSWMKAPLRVEWE